MTERGCGPFLNAIYGSQRAASASATVKRPRERTLASTYLSNPSVDGWNVVFGATELARVWALRDLEEFPRNPEMPDDYDLPLLVRKRLAACLSVSFKFQRAMYSYFPRDFHDDEHSLLSPHTKELAHIGFAFMTADEEAEFGGWNAQNKPAIDALYAEMLALEVDLLTSVNTFSLLTCNFQVVAEDVLACLLARGLRTGQGDARAARAGGLLRQGRRRRAARGHGVHAAQGGGHRAGLRGVGVREPGGQRAALPLARHGGALAL